MNSDGFLYRDGPQQQILMSLPAKMDKLLDAWQMVYSHRPAVEGSEVGLKNE